MAGALIQLVAYGVEDLYLTHEPQITFFKMLYRRHTNFAVESIMQNFSSRPNFGEIVTATIPHAGDLVGQIFLFVQLPPILPFIDPCTGKVDPIKKLAWVRSLGYALILEVQIDIGDKLIDRQYGEWMYIWSQLTNRQDIGLAKLLGNVPSMYEFSCGKNSYDLYIPLDFWFCRHDGLALPLIALGSTDVKLTITFRRLEECIRIGPTHSIQIIEDVVPFVLGDYIEQSIGGQTIRGYVIDYDYLTKRLYYIKIQSRNATLRNFQSLLQPTDSITILNNPSFIGNVPFRIYNTITGSYCTPQPNQHESAESWQLSGSFLPRFVNSFLFINYYYLDNEERLKFARSNHEYLIEQIQYNQLLDVRSSTVKQNLALNHPCKSHYWVVQLDSLVGPGTINDLFNFTDSPVRYPDGRLYGHDPVLLGSIYINGRERFSERTAIYFNLTQPLRHHYRGPEPGINMYSFSLNPEEYQPSGTINMSKIDYIYTLMRLSPRITPQNTARIRAYTLNYNILRIFYNLGGLAFVN
jgi:hypothetical protein